MKAIETKYNGYKFRSRLEARWAVFFDEMGIKYEYEPEGFELSDGTKYLPDFYLPESGSFFEVKGIMNDKDMHKVLLFIDDSKKSVAVGYNDFSFQSCDMYGPDLFVLTEKESSLLCRCPTCGKYWFMGNCGTYACQCCGAYDGDAPLRDCLQGNPEWRLDWSDKKFDDALRKARQARFEYGESG